LLALLNPFSAKDVLPRDKTLTVQARDALKRLMYYSIFSALQALQEHFCWSIHYTHALCCHLYTILGLVPNVLILLKVIDSEYTASDCC